MTTFCKKKVALHPIFFYTCGVSKDSQVNETDLAALAKRCRVASGRNRAQAARELGVARPTLIQAEDSPAKSLFKLRKRIIEKYSRYKLVGPVYWLRQK